jgi:hypothetical protein
VGRVGEHDAVVVTTTSAADAAVVAVMKRERSLAWVGAVGRLAGRVGVRVGEVVRMVAGIVRVGGVLTWRHLQAA